MIQENVPRKSTFRPLFELYLNTYVSYSIEVFNLNVPLKILIYFEYKIFDIVAIELEIFEKITLNKLTQKTRLEF